MRRNAPFHLGTVVAVLAVAQLILIIGSWMVNAVWPDTGVRPLLSSEGVRWFFGHFSDMVGTPPMVWLLLLGIAYGVVRRSRVCRSHRATARRSFALIVVIAELVAFVALMALMAFMPHALLLSASGTLFPSSFSDSVIPYTALAATVMGATYGLISGTLPSLKSLFHAAVHGISIVAPLLLTGVFAAQFVFSLLYVFAPHIPFSRM